MPPPKDSVLGRPTLLVFSPHERYLHALSNQVLFLTNKFQNYIILLQITSIYDYTTPYI